MLHNDAPEFRKGAPLPGFRPATDAIMVALSALYPPERVSVSQVATRRKVNAGGTWKFWDNSVSPYMVEPMDVTLSRRFEGVIFVGPARSSKTEGLIINPWVHSVLASPKLASIFYMSQPAVREWSIQELGPIIKNSPDMAERLILNNVFEKKFKGGARVTLDWPVDNKLSGRSIPLVLLADYDQKAYQNVEGQGPAFTLARKRTQQAGTRGMVVAESSPRMPILDESWRPTSPHEAPPCEGILGLYNLGTRARLYWTCPDCGGEFEPSVDRLEYPSEGTPAARGRGVFMVCLHCGSILEPRHKAELNRKSRWLHEGKDGDLVPFEETDALRDTQLVSYWLKGPAAALAPWSQIVTRYLEAEEEFNRTGDEKPLQSIVNLDHGLPYMPRTMSEDMVLSAKGLEDGATDHAWQVCPAETRFLIAAVDVQKGRFVVQIMAHLAENERVLVDRFDLITPPSSSPRAADRQLDPAKYLEDWDALLPLFSLSYPVANAEHDLRLIGIVSDAAGEPGVTTRAYGFYRKMKKLHPLRFHLVRGFGGLDRQRAEVKAPESSHKGRKFAAKDIQLIRAGTDRLKDDIASSLLRTESGSSKIHIPRGAPKEVFAEFAAERRDKDGWSLKKGIKRNEALDLTVYDLALSLVLGVEKIKDWSRPPAWALSGPKNTFAVREIQTAEEKSSPKKKKRRPGRRSRRFDGW